MSKILKVGILGCAKIAERMVIPAILESHLLELTVVASRSLSKAIEYGEKFGCQFVEGYENLLKRDDVDVVYMPLPNALHFKWAMKALEHGKHILIEKSLALNFTEAKSITDKAEAANLLVQENFMFPYHRQFTFIKDVLAKGTLGKIRCVRSSFGFPPFPDEDNIRYSESLGGGAFLDAGAYTIKVAQLLLGHLVADGGCLFYDHIKRVDFNGGFFMHDKHGVIVETAFGFDHFYQCELEVWGSEGKLTAERIFTAGPGIKPKIFIETKQETKVYEIEADNHFLNLLNDFAGCIITGSLKTKFGGVFQQAKLMQECYDAAEKIYIDQQQKIDPTTDPGL